MYLLLVLSSHAGTIFAYGQTGTGKTYTMEGRPSYGRGGGGGYNHVQRDDMPEFGLSLYLEAHKVHKTSSVARRNGCLLLSLLCVY